MRDGRSCEMLHGDYYAEPYCTIKRSLFFISRLGSLNSPFAFYVSDIILQLRKILRAIVSVGYYLSLMSSSYP